MKALVSLCALGLLIPLAAGAMETKSGTNAAGKPKFTATEKMTAQATVLSVNKSKRIVTIRSADGDTVDIECGPQIKNFAQIHAGDVIDLAYSEKLTVEVGGAEAPGASGSVTATTAKPGEKPKGNVSSTYQYKATIKSIDKTKGTVDIQGADGREATITPKNPANLNKVKVGETVMFTYTEALALSIKKATK